MARNNKNQGRNQLNRNKENNTKTQPTQELVEKIKQNWTTFVTNNKKKQREDPNKQTQK